MSANENEKKYLSKKILEVEELVESLKGFFHLPMEVKIVNDSDIEQAKKDLIKIILLCSDMHKEIEENKIPF